MPHVSVAHWDGGHFIAGEIKLYQRKVGQVCRKTQTYLHSERKPRLDRQRTSGEHQERGRFTFSTRLRWLQDLMTETINVCVQPAPTGRKHSFRKPFFCACKYLLRHFWRKTDEMCLLFKDLFMSKLTSLYDEDCSKIKAAFTEISM